MIRVYRGIGSTRASYINALGSGKSQASGGQIENVTMLRDNIVLSLKPLPLNFKINEIINIPLKDQHTNEAMYV